MYCSRCGVEVDPAVDNCPLCDAPIQKLPLDDGSPWPSEEAPVTSPPPMSSDERKALSRTITTLGFLIPASIVLTVDWFISRSLNWSLIVLVSLGAAWLWALVPLIFNRRPYLLIASITVIALALQVALGLLAGDTSWILPIGIPIVGSAGILSTGVTALARSARRVGGNLAGWILLAIAVLSVETDILVSSWMNESWRPGWSIIVASTLLPIAVLLLFLHYRPSRQKRLRRYFHV
ncbi:MAG: hypothetical protein KAJ98_15025 [Spirochaetaceae bacterium]|nr:hypothetical protein [Spirochaetaceae bacterium]